MNNQIQRPSSPALLERAMKMLDKSREHRDKGTPPGPDMQALREREVSVGGVNPGAAPGELLGQILMNQGKISDPDIARVLEYAGKRHLRFGDAAVRLGLITDDDRDRALAIQFDFPYLEAGTGGYSSELVAAYKPFSEKGLALRLVRAQLSRPGDAANKCTLAIVSARRHEGRSYLAANLAVVFSQLGRRTLLVDGALPDGRQHELFRASNEVGLSACLVGRAPVETLVRQLPDFRNLSLLPRGAAPPNPSELLGRSVLADLVSEVRNRYDVVIFDTSPMRANCGAEAIAGACGTALAVLRKGTTTLSDTRALLDVLTGAGATVVGSVLADF